MLRKSELSLSKGEFLQSSLLSQKLNIEDIFALSQHYAKKGLRIYVQTYFPPELKQEAIAYKLKLMDRGSHFVSLNEGFFYIEGVNKLGIHFLTLMGGKAIQEIISWSVLPPEFPRELELILKLQPQDPFYQALFDYTWRLGYTKIQESWVKNVLKIQDQLEEGRTGAYVHTDGLSPRSTGHIECLIITKKWIIKPVFWNASYSLKLDEIKYSASTNLRDFSSNTTRLIPQIDHRACAALSLAYAKQLLAEDGKQLKELTLIIPYYSANSLAKEPLPSFFFLPSPKVLYYSQNEAYNKYLYAMVMEDEPGFFTNQGREIFFITLRHKLEETQKEARKYQQVDVKKEVNFLLKKLVEFRQRWGEAFKKVEQMRVLMQAKEENRVLAYTSVRMKKKLLQEKGEPARVKANLQGHELTKLGFWRSPSIKTQDKENLNQDLTAFSLDG